MPLPLPDESALFAAYLEEMEGVGRVTAGRLLHHFASLAALRAYPREQVLARIKGAPNAEGLVGRLFDETASAPLLAAASERLSRLSERGVQLLTPRHEHWPAGLSDLPRGQRPFVLYAYGRLDALARPRVALPARPPLPADAFEQAQRLTRTLLAEGIVPATGIDHGFDVVVHKIAGDAAGPGLMLAACGLARLPGPMRPAVSAAVKAGGLLLSPFRMDHGPFAHDEQDRSLMLTALSDAVVFVAPRPETAEWRAMGWALEAGRPVFACPGEDAPLPEAVHRLTSDVDAEWVAAAVGQARTGP